MQDVENANTEDHEYGERNNLVEGEDGALDAGGSFLPLNDDGEGDDEVDWAALMKKSSVQQKKDGDRRKSVHSARGVPAVHSGIPSSSRHGANTGRSLNASRARPDGSVLLRDHRGIAASVNSSEDAGDTPKNAATAVVPATASANANAGATSGGAAVNGGAGKKTSQKKVRGVATPRTSSWHSIKTLHLPFLLPLLSLVVVHVTMFAMTTVTSNTIDNVFKASALAAERVGSMLEADYTLVHAVSSASYAAEVAEYLNGAETTLMRLRQVHAVLELGIDDTTLATEEGHVPLPLPVTVNGEEASGIAGVTSDSTATIRSILFSTSTCDFVDKVLAAGKASGTANGPLLLSEYFNVDCRSVGNGLASSGVDAALDYWVNTIRLLLLTRAASTVGPYSTDGTGPLNVTAFNLATLTNSIAGLGIDVSGGSNYGTQGTLTNGTTYSTSKVLLSPQLGNIRTVMFGILYPAFYGIYNTYKLEAQDLVVQYNKFSNMFPAIMLVVIVVVGW